MIKFFYRQGSDILLGQSETEFAAISKENVLWIDLLQPTGDQKRAVESFLGTEIQSRAEAEEIESSSRFFEEGGALFANTNFLSPADDEMLMDPVSFILVGPTLTTIREIPLRSLDTLQLKIQALPDEFPDGFTIFVAIMDRRVDLDADLVELISKDVSRFSKRINQKEDINEDFLLDINQLQQNATDLRENIVDKQRLVSNLLKSKLCPRDTETRGDLTIILQDISSLINHINFAFERLEYMQDKCERILFTPVDIPLFTSDTVKALLASEAELACPVCDGQRGHPIMIASKLVGTILNDHGAGGLNGALSRCGTEMTEIGVEDAGILHDADTPEDYRALLQFHNQHLVRPVVSVALSKEKPFFDDKIAMLLTMVDETASVRTACQRMQISYSTGWNIIRTMESQFSRTLIERTQGGAGGGQSRLTDDGRELIARFHAYEEELRRKANELFGEYFDGVL